MTAPATPVEDETLAILGLTDDEIIELRKQARTGHVSRAVNATLTFPTR